jgi:flagellar basal body-associated protein FliL
VKKIENRPSRTLLIIYRVLVALALILILILAAGTVFGLIRGSRARPVLSFGAGGTNSGPGASGASGAPGDASPPESSVFTGIGRLRIAAGASTVILSITFPYPPGDSAFTEELVARAGSFRETASAYFGALTREELETLDEEKAKAELLGRFNRTLRLGKIGVLYFSDFMIID